MTKPNFAASPLIDIKKRKCSRNCIHVVMWRILILSWYIKQSLSVSSSLLHGKSLDWDLIMRVIRDIIACYSELYNNPSYSRILIVSHLWSIRGQAHDLRHHYKVFPSAVLKWRKVLRIRIIFYVTGQKIRFKKVLPRHWTGLRNQKTKDRAVSFRKWYRNNFLAASVGSRARLNHAQTWSW